MQQLLQVRFHGVEHSDAVEQRIQEKFAELERFHDRIMSCRVTVDAPHGRHHQGNLYAIRIDMHLPDNEIVIDRGNHDKHAHEDVYVAIRDAFRAVTRQLQDRTRKQRGKVKHHDVPDHGRVTRLFPQDGYGFVERADGVDVYFHENSVSGDAFDVLEVGDEVRLVVAAEMGEQGVQASTVTRVGKHHIVDR